MYAAFEEATSIMMGLILYPMLLLMGGVMIDRLLSTTPIFIFIGIIAGVGFGIHRANKIAKKYEELKQKLKKNKKINV